MKYLKVDFHDNDFCTYFREVGEDILEHYYETDGELDEWNENFLTKLKIVIIEMVAIKIQLGQLCECARRIEAYETLDETRRRLYNNTDYRKYFSNIRLSIIDIGRDKIVEWNNSETLYVPLENCDYIEPFCA